jgi:hypothetical protein
LYVLWHVDPLLPTEDKIDDIKDKFYEELEQVFDKFPRYYMKILLGNFSAKVGREDIFKPTIESLHEISNDQNNKKTLLSRVRSFHFITFIKLFGHLLMGGRTIKF